MNHLQEERFIETEGRTVVARGDVIPDQEVQGDMVV